MKMIQYGKQTIEQSDIDAVVEVLKTNTYLTTGPWVKKFEQDVANLVGAKHAVAVNSGTAALHCAINALEIGPGDEVIVASMSFAASANVVVYEGGTPVFCDVCPDTSNIDPVEAEKLVTERTVAIMAVDFAGQPPDYHALQKICDKYGLYLIQDAAHSFGLQVTSCPRKPWIGNCADLTTFSFHPVKNITTAEGGMICTNNDKFAERMYRFRTHGINKNHYDRKLHEYDIPELGYNYRIPDILCALGSNQMTRVKQWIQRRQEIAEIYDSAFASEAQYFVPLTNKYGSAYHIYIIKLNLETLNGTRDDIFTALREGGIGVNVHYKPIHLHTYYQNRTDLKTAIGTCPVVEKLYQEIITLPIYPTLTTDEINTVICVVKKVISDFAISIRNFV